MIQQRIDHPPEPTSRVPGVRASMSGSPSSRMRFRSSMPSSAVAAAIPTGKATSLGPPAEKLVTRPLAAPVEYDHAQSRSSCSR